jgi:hypothetical protein
MLQDASSHNDPEIVDEVVDTGGFEQDNAIPAPEADAHPHTEETLKKLAVESAVDPKNQAAALEWIGRREYKKALELRRRAIEDKGSVGALAKAWNRLNAEDQREFALKHTMGKEAKGKLGEAATGVVGKALKVPGAVVRTAKKIALPDFLLRIRNWSPELIMKYIVMGVLDCKDPNLPDQVDALNLDFLKKAGGVAALAEKLFPEAALITKTGAVAAGVEAKRITTMKGLREAVQAEIPAHPVEDTLDEEHHKVEGTHVLDKKSANNNDAFEEAAA